jgi:hypothetical protein
MFEFDNFVLLAPDLTVLGDDGVLELCVAVQVCSGGIVGT